MNLSCYQGSQHNPCTDNNDVEGEVDEAPLQVVPNNFVVFYATAPGRYSKRSKDGGSRMETAIQEVLLLKKYQESKEMDFFEFLTDVTREVSRKEFYDKDKKVSKNVPQLVHRVKEPIIFQLKQKDLEDTKLPEAAGLF